MTNHHRLDGLEQRKFILSLFWMLDIENKDIRGAMLPPEALEKNLFLASSTSGAAGVACHPLSVATSLHSLPLPSRGPPFHVVSPWVCSQLPLPLYVYVLLGPSWVIWRGPLSIPLT